MDTTVIKKGIKVACVAYVCSITSLNFSKITMPTEEDVLKSFKNLPTKEDVHLFRVLAPKFVGLIPDSLIAKDLPVSVARERKNQVRQFIIAGADLFDLVLDTLPSKLSEESQLLPSKGTPVIESLKQHLKQALDEFNSSTKALSTKATELKTITKSLENATDEQKLRIIEKQMSISLDMLDTLSDPLSTASKAFQELNDDIISKLLHMVEVIPVVKKYLSIKQDGTKDAMPLSQFITGKLQEMVSYTKNQIILAKNVKRYMTELKTLHETCNKDLMAYKEQLKTALEANKTALSVSKTPQPIPMPKETPKKIEEKKREIYATEEEFPEEEQPEEMEDLFEEEKVSPQKQALNEYIYQRGQAVERSSKSQQAPLPDYLESEWE